jgi:transcriptional regulator with XRE-family HTH domain
MPSRILVDPTFAPLLRELRLARGLSVRGLAAAANFSHTHLGDLEAGRKTPSPEAARHLDSVLASGTQLSTLVTTVEDRPATVPAPGPARQAEQLRRRLHEAIASGMTSEASVEDWERTAFDYGRATRFRPAGVLLHDLSTDCAELLTQLDRRHPASALRRLTRVSAQMAGLMFLTLIKLDERPAARAWARTAYLAADEAGDPALRSWVRAQEAYVHFYSGDIREAIVVASHAAAVAGRSPSVGVALAAALQARAHAVIGDTAATHASVDAAERALADLDDGDLIASAFGYNEAQLRFHEGNAYTHLHDSARAWAAQQRALELYDPIDYLDRALVHLDRMSCLNSDGDAGDAIGYGTATLTALTADQRRGMIDIRAREVIDAFPPAQWALPAARELREMVTLPATDEER